jgi:hypothetical protein
MIVKTYYRDGTERVDQADTVIRRPPYRDGTERVDQADTVIDRADTVEIIQGKDLVRIAMGDVLNIYVQDGVATVARYSGTEAGLVAE